MEKNLLWDLFYLKKLTVDLPELVPKVEVKEMSFVLISKVSLVYPEKPVSLSTTYRDF